MEVILAKSAGFCFGVQRAVDMAYQEGQARRKSIPLVRLSTMRKSLRI